MNAGRSVLLYLILVGIPLSGLLGILRGGEQITAPRAIGGSWELDPESAGQLAGSCLGLPTGLAQLELVQSGTRAELRLPGRSARVISIVLRGDQIGGRLLAPASSPCAEQPLGLSGRISQEDGVQRLTGTIEAPGCAACAAAAFTAVRLPISTER
jgi:hypothetical protein